MFCLEHFFGFLSFHTLGMVTASLVSSIRKVSAHFAMHLSLLFIVIQPYKLWKPLFSKSASSHLSLLFIFFPWCWLFLFCSFLAVCMNSTLNFSLRGKRRERLPANPSILKNAHWLSRLTSFIDWQHCDRAKKIYIYSVTKYSGEGQKSLTFLVV